MKVMARGNLFVPVTAALIVVAWAALWAWHQSPYGRLMHHGGVTPASASVYVVGWLLMIVAMMLPTTLPLLDIFRRLSARRRDRAWLVSLLVGGYLAVWLAFGIGAYLADWAVRALLARTAPAEAAPWPFGAAALIVAGAFQFSRLKYRCLDKCRAPLGFVLRYWRRQGGPAAALTLGVRHGGFCVGCCWALMLLMFAIGAGNIGWMLVLGALMAIEKNTPQGRRFGPVLGVALLAWGGAIAVHHGLG